MDLKLWVFLFKSLFKKKGAIKGPDAPTNTVAIPLIVPTHKNDLLLFFFLKKRYQIIKTPINGLSISNFNWFADETFEKWIRILIIQIELA